MTKTDIKERILVVCAFMFFFMITTYKLTNAPLWFDETVEYWYSKIMFGKLPFNGARLFESTNMYQRIVSTFQPPLYNFVMFFWLKVSDNEWWFRFFGVVMGFFANIAIYKTIKKLSNYFIAFLSVCFCSCIYQLVYYWQECAEYCLMLAALCWTLYYFVSLIDEQSVLNIIFFMVFSVVAIYSQYGVVFPIISMCVVVYSYALYNKNKLLISRLSIAFVAAFMTAGLPLVHFFLIKQINVQQGGIVRRKMFIDKNIVRDFFSAMETVLEWNLFSVCGKKVSIVFGVVFIVLGVGLFLNGRRIFKILLYVNVITWIMYYIAVKLGIYSYGEFGNRYNIFFIPLWIILLFDLVAESFRVVNEKFDVKKSVHVVEGVGICFFVLLFIITNWNIKLKNNWTKENMRDAVTKWMEEELFTSNTIVYYAGNSGFAYYLRNSDKYNLELEKNVTYMEWLRDKSEEEYREYIDYVYKNNWPNEIYIIGSHTREDFDTLVSVFEKTGYICTDIYSNNARIKKCMIE